MFITLTYPLLAPVSAWLITHTWWGEKVTSQSLCRVCGCHIPLYISISRGFQTVAMETSLHCDPSCGNTLLKRNSANQCNGIVATGLVLLQPYLHSSVWSLCRVTANAIVLTSRHRVPLFKCTVCINRLQSHTLQEVWGSTQSCWFSLSSALRKLSRCKLKFGHCSLFSN